MSKDLLNIAGVANQVWAVVPSGKDISEGFAAAALYQIWRVATEGWFYQDVRQVERTADYADSDVVFRFDNFGGPGYVTGSAKMLDSDCVAATPVGAKWLITYRARIVTRNASNKTHHWDPGEWTVVVDVTPTVYLVELRRRYNQWLESPQSGTETGLEVIAILFAIEISDEDYWFAKENL